MKKPKRLRIRYWVLRDQVTEEFFQGMIAIGPMTTNSLGEAHKFLTKQSAMTSPAYSSLLCDFEPEAIRRG